MPSGPIVPPSKRMTIAQAKALGAMCEICPCAQGPKPPRMVPPMPPSGELKYVAVGEWPGHIEESQGVPMIGPTGQFFNKFLQESGLDRSNGYITNAALCRSEGDRDKQRSAQCCAPRLQRELAAIDPAIPIMTMGKAPMAAVLGHSKLFMSRGFYWKTPTIEDGAVRTAFRKAEKAVGKPTYPELLRRARVLEGRQKLANRVVWPTLQPAFVFGADAWKPALKQDVLRFGKIVRGELGEKDLEDRAPYWLFRTPWKVKKALGLLGPVVAVDIETDDIDPLNLNILCVGISDGQKTLVIGPWDKKTHADILRRALGKRKVVFHNGVNFDILALEADGVTLDWQQIEDTLIAHHTIGSHFPQRLDHCVSMYLFSSPWKIRFGRKGQAEKGVAPKHMPKSELYKYNACLKLGTAVMLADGTTRKIETIVRHRQEVDVLSFGPNGIEAKRVTGWIRTRAPGQAWVSIKTATTDIHGLTATPDHGIYTDRGKIRADEVRVGDRIATALGSERLPFYAEVVDVRGPYVPPLAECKTQRLADETRFCLTVEDNHNFFTTKGLVSNCDAVLTKRLWDAMQDDLLRHNGMRVYDHDMTLAFYAASLIKNGMPVDVARRMTLRVNMVKKAEELRDKMRRLSGNPAFHPSIHSHIREALFGKFKLKVLSPTPTGLPSTASSTLEVYRDNGTPGGELAAAILDWRSVDKSRSTYVDALPVKPVKGLGDRLRVNWKVYATPSGRWGSRAQSFPRIEFDDQKQLILESRVREYIAARPGYELVHFDLKQAEAFAAAYLSQDQAFIENCQTDIHIGNGCIVFPEHADIIKSEPKGRGKKFRDIAKNFMYGINYLAEAKTIHKFIIGKGFPVQLRHVEKALDLLRGAYKTYFRYVEANVEWVRMHGYLVSPLMHRMRWLGRHVKPTEVANWPPQSFVADIVNERMIEIMPQITDPRIIFIGQWHDSMIWEVPKGPPVDDLQQLIADTWAPAVTIPKSIVCPTGAEFVVGVDIHSGHRWSEL